MILKLGMHHDKIIRGKIMPWDFRRMYLKNLGSKIIRKKFLASGSYAILIYLEPRVKFDTNNFRSSLFVQKGRNITFPYENLTQKDLKGHFLAKLLPSWVRYPKNNVL